MKRSFNVPGYNKDVRRSVANYLSSLAWDLSKNKMRRGFSRAFEGLPPNIPQVSKYLQDYVKHQLSNDGEAAQWRKAITAMTIAGRVSSAALNLTQQVSTTLPKLVEETNSFTQGTAEWVKAQALLARRVADPEGFAKNNPELSAALDIAIKDGIVSEAQFREMAGIASGREDSTFDSVLNTSLVFFDLAEKANRYQAFIASYNVAKKKGMDAPTAIKYAGEFVKDTQFVYDKTNTPKWFRGSAGAIIGQYKKFFLNDLALYSNLATSAAKGNTGAAKGLITKMAAMVALGGLSNMAPGIRDLDKLLMAGGIDTKEALREFFKDSQFAADFSSNGLLYALGLPDISQAVGNEILDLPDRYDNDALETTFGKLVGGVSIGVGQKLINAAQLAADGKYMKAAQQPVAGFSGPLRAIETMMNPERGLTNNRGDTMVPNVTKGEIASLFGGFNPARNRREQDLMRSATKLGAKASDNDNINERLAEAKLNKESLTPIINAYYKAQSKKPLYARRSINWTSVAQIEKRKRNPLQAKIDSMPKAARAEAMKRYGKYME
jgi:hypothetical protein